MRTNYCNVARVNCNGRAAIIGILLSGLEIYNSPSRKDSAKPSEHVATAIIGQKRITFFHNILCEKTALCFVSDGLIFIIFLDIK